MERIAVVGLGYSGLPLAIALSRVFKDVIGYDSDAVKVGELIRGHDRTGTMPIEELATTKLRFTTDFSDLTDSTFYIVTIPTAVHSDKTPNLDQLLNATEIVGFCLKKGDVVVYESTVFPGATEDVFVPVLQDCSRLKRCEFNVGYSPARINAEDREHRLDNTIKVVAGQNANVTERIADVYAAITTVHRAKSIRVAEAAKAIENAQRDVNVALMNEFSKMFAAAGVSTNEVLATARTKWDFVDFKPSLVGGYGGDVPHYLTMLGDHVKEPLRIVSLAHRVNEHMPKYVAKRLIDALNVSNRGFYRGARIGVLGYTSKEDVKDTRGSKVPDLVRSLRARGCEVYVHDPIAQLECSLKTGYKHVFRKTKEELVDVFEKRGLDAIVIAVPHTVYLDTLEKRVNLCVADGGVVVDLNGVVDASKLRDDLTLVLV